MEQARERSQIWLNYFHQKETPPAPAPQNNPTQPENQRSRDVLPPDHEPQTPNDTASNLTGTSAIDAEHPDSTQNKAIILEPKTDVS
jgi:hypothetical protein